MKPIYMNVHVYLKLAIIFSVRVTLQVYTGKHNTPSLRNIKDIIIFAKYTIIALSIKTLVTIRLGLRYLFTALAPYYRVVFFGGQ